MHKQNIPDLEKAQKLFREFCETIATLRDPISGCPWDLEQNHKTLRRYMIEEAYEAAEAMDSDDSDDIMGELGDVLLQVVLNAQVGLDNKKFDISDVINSINEKMKRRHPHVFGNDEEKAKREMSQIKSKWQEIKEEEKKNLNHSQLSFFEKEKIHKIYPATRKAFEIGKSAKKINFDWDGPMPVFDKLISEVEELAVEMKCKNQNQAKIYDELGDVYFTLAHLCRHLGLDPETVAEDGNRKFLRRFKSLELIAKKKNIAIDDASQEILEQLWLDAKKLEK